MYSSVCDVGLGGARLPSTAIIVTSSTDWATISTISKSEKPRTAHFKALRMQNGARNRFKPE
jgi:hypothetical protein